MRRAGADWKIAPEEVAEVVLNLSAPQSEKPAEPRGDAAVETQEVNACSSQLSALSARPAAELKADS